MTTPHAPPATFRPTEPPVVTFARCGRGQWRGAAISGRVYWLTIYVPGQWQVRCAENEDAREGEALAFGSLAECKAEARRIEAERVREERV